MSTDQNLTSAPAPVSRAPASATVATATDALEKTDARILDEGETPALLAERRERAEDLARAKGQLAMVERRAAQAATEQAAAAKAADLALCARLEVQVTTEYQASLLADAEQLVATMRTEGARRSAARRRSDVTMAAQQQLVGLAKQLGVALPPLGHPHVSDIDNTVKRLLGAAGAGAQDAWDLFVLAK